MGSGSGGRNSWPCHVCGKESNWLKGGAWHPFGGMACSDACGEAAQAALKKLHKSSEYQKHLDSLREAQSAMYDLEGQAIRQAGEKISDNQTKENGEA